MPAVIVAGPTDDSGFVVTTDLGTACAEGLVSGAVMGQSTGFNTATTVGQLSVTSYTEQSGSLPRSLASSNVNDSSLGTGAEQIAVSGYDNTMTAVSETVTLNGTTAVATVHSYQFIESLTVSKAGSGGANAGTITLYVNNSGGGGTITTIGVGNVIAGVGDNQTFLGMHYVRASKTCYINGVAWGLDGIEPSVGLLLRVVNPLAIGPAETTAFMPLANRFVSGSYKLTNPITITGPSRVRLYRTSTTGNYISGMFEYMEF